MVKVWRAEEQYGSGWATHTQYTVVYITMFISYLDQGVASKYLVAAGGRATRGQYWQGFQSLLNGRWVHFPCSFQFYTVHYGVHFDS